MLIYNPNLRKFAKELREHMTDAEIRLWSRIRMRRLNNHSFFRQRIINNYIVDFYCPKAKLIIEIDGAQHFTPELALKDAKRDDYFKSRGMSVLRFTDTEVLNNTESVLNQILVNIGDL